MARAAADEAARLAAETKQPLYLANAQTAQAALAGLHGDESLAQRLAAEAEGVTLPVGGRAVLSAAQLARGFAALSAGRYADAYANFRRMFDPADPAYHHGERLWGLADYVEAAARSGHRAEASAVDRRRLEQQHDGADAVARAIPSFLVAIPCGRRSGRGRLDGRPHR